MGLKGINGLRRRVGSVKRAIEGDLFEESGQEWGEKDFLPNARAECPKDTRHLESTIGVSVNQNQIRVYASASYASIVHDGRSNKEANPFLQRAYKRTRPRLSRYMRQKLKEANR